MPFSISKYHFGSNDMLIHLLESNQLLNQENILRMVEKKGKIIYREGSYSLGVYILLDGKVKIYQTNKEGKEQIAYIYRKGDIMGYRPLLSEEPHPVSAAALEDSVLAFIPRDQFMNLLDQSPVLARNLLTNLCHEFTVWINKLTVFGQQPVKQRVALSLLILNEKYKSDEKDDQSLVTIDLSREDLANYAGTTVETMVRMIRSLKNDGILSSKGRKIIIERPDLLEKIADFS